MLKLFARPHLCVNCRICEMICSLENSGMFTPAKARIWIDRNKKGQDTPMICRHCLNPPCKEACQVDGEKPIQRDDKTGIVKFDSEKCDNCHTCVDACPFQAIRIDKNTGQINKCNLCNGDPACVKWCPTGAIQVIDSKAIGAVVAIEKI